MHVLNLISVSAILVSSLTPSLTHSLTHILPAGTHVVRVFIDDAHIAQLRVDVNGAIEDENIAISSPVQSANIDLNTTGYFSLPTDIGGLGAPQSAGRWICFNTTFGKGTFNVIIYHLMIFSTQSLTHSLTHSHSLDRGRKSKQVNKKLFTDSDKLPTLSDNDSEVESTLPTDDDLSTLAPITQTSAQLQTPLPDDSVNTADNRVSEVRAEQAGDGSLDKQDSNIAPNETVTSPSNSVDQWKSVSSTLSFTDPTAVATATTDKPIEHAHSHEIHSLAESSESYRQSVYYEALDTPHTVPTDGQEHTDVFVDASSDIIMREGSVGKGGSRPISMTGSVSEMTQESLRLLCPGQTSVDLYLQGVDNMVSGIDDIMMMIMMMMMMMMILT